MNLRGIIIGVAILILTLFVTTYGVNTVFDKPIYDDFCPNTIWKVTEMNESVCFDNGGKWNPNVYVGRINPEVPQKNLNGEVTGYCDKNFRCNEAYQLAQERYSMNAFLIAVPLGILILLGGFFFFSLESVGVGIMAGGVGTLLRGVGSYWRYSEDWLRFVISLAGLVIVIWASYKFSSKFEKKVKKK